MVVASDEPRRIMLDIETLGTQPGAALLSIGAVEFRPTTAFDAADGILDTFHASVSATSCQEAGLHIDAETLEWWAGKANASEQLLGGSELDQVLRDLQLFIDTEGDLEVWAKSPSFDCVLLDAAYRAIHHDGGPWEYWQERDVRTIASLPMAPAPEDIGQDHDALDDAKQQAVLVAQTLARLDGGED